MSRANQQMGESRNTEYVKRANVTSVPTGGPMKANERIESHLSHAELIKKANRASRARNYEAATSFLEQAAALDPSDAAVHYELALLQNQQGRFEAAATSFQRAVKADPSDPTAWNNLGVALYAQGKWKQAERAFRQAIVLDVSYAEAYYDLAKALGKQGQNQEAVQALRTCLYWQPRHTLARKNLESMASNIHRRRVLLYDPFSLWYHHFATDLEIALTHIVQGDEVHIVQCSGCLPYCEPNKSHDLSTCIGCVAMCNTGWNTIKIPMHYRHDLALGYHKRNLNFPEFPSIDELKAFEVNGVDHGMAVASSLIYMTHEPHPDTRRYKVFIEKTLQMSVAIYDALAYYFRKLQPDVFYLFQGRWVPLRAALRAAQNLGVKTFVHDRGGVLTRYNLSEDTYPHDLEYSKRQIEAHWHRNKDIPYKTKEQLARDWYEERRGGQEQSWYSFVKDQHANLLPTTFDPTKRNISIFISTEDEFEAVSGWQIPLFSDQNEAILFLANMTPDENVHYYVRVHPNLKGRDNNQTKGLFALRSSRLTIIPADSPVSTYALMEACEKTITFGSTMGIESAFWGKPFILAGRSLYEDLGACYIPKDRRDFLELANRHLPPLPKLGTIKYGYWVATMGQQYVYYTPEGINNGKFLGKYIRPTITDLAEIAKITDMIKANTAKLALG